ncbi:MAG: hypothetical protein ACO3AA_05350 [Chitinophagaceae bacterium]
MHRLLSLLIINLLPFFLFAWGLPDSSKPISLLYNGAEYVKQFNIANGDPFFPVKKNIGSVKYHQNWYNQIEVHYDCEDDYVLIRDMQGLLKLRLINEMLDEFIIDEHHFVKKSIVSSKGEFYEMIFSGKRELLVKWFKKMNTDVKTIDTYILKKDILLIDGGKIHNILNVNDICSFAGIHSREVKKALKEAKVSFKKEPIKAAKIILTEMESKGW